MKSERISYILLASVVLLAGCQNKELNDGEQFRPRDISEDFRDSHFSHVWVDGVEYLMLMKDNNNPHEGFGFMALRGNIILEKQDSTLAYLRTIGEFQVQIMAQLKKQSEEEIRQQFLDTYFMYLKQEQPELERLEQDSLIAR